MNMTMVDVTDIAAQPDDEVVLLGRQETPKSGLKSWPKNWNDCLRSRVANQSRIPGSRQGKRSYLPRQRRGFAPVLAPQ
jgi:hypothetical protein